MEKENIVLTEFDFTLIANFFKSLNRQGPGSDAQTLRAISFLSDMPSNAKIADIGCGTGSQTVVLARTLDAEITAVDLLPEMIEEINKRINKENLAERISPLQASMDALPFKPQSLDAIWAEGSIFIIGFEKGMQQWRQFIKEGGFIAVTECCWLNDRRPQDIEWFNENLPEIDTIANKISIMQKSGYTPLAHFILTTDCWNENYYYPMNQRMKDFLEENNNSDAARFFVERMMDEIDHYNKYHDMYGYVFFIGRKE